MSIDREILSGLRRAGEAGISGADLAQRLGVTRAAVWARVEELRALGYDIEASPLLGYRLVGTPDLLHADDLLSRLSKTTAVIGRDIRVFQETTSTNDVVDKLARDGVKEGVVVFAESQRKGRGRLGRKWLSLARKGLWFSVLLRPLLRPQAVTQLTVAAATALARGIRRYAGLIPTIKWPNDILIDGLKTAGILTELSAELDHIKYTVLGIGVDVNMTQAEFSPDLRRVATSLRIQVGRNLDRAALAVALLQELDADYARIQAGQFHVIADEWASQCATVGKDVRIRVGQRIVEGRAETLDEDGALLIRSQHGHIERITGGDVAVQA